jgi:hypothetical protein
MPFEFINNNSLTNATRRRIRSHAALGKNKGKKITRRSRKDVLTTATAQFRVPLRVQAVSEAEKKVQDIERPVDDGLFFPGLRPGESKGLVKKGISLFQTYWPGLNLAEGTFLVISFISSVRFSPEMNNGLDYEGLGTPICVQYMFVDEACKECPCSSRSISHY